MIDQALRHRFDRALDELHRSLPDGSTVEVRQVTTQVTDDGDVLITLIWQCLHPTGETDLRRTRWLMCRSVAPRLV